MKAPKPAKTPEAAGDAEQPPKKNSRKKLILIGAPVAVLLLAGGGLWFTGILPRLLGLGPKPKKAVAAKPVPPSYVDIPVMIANLNNGNGQPAYLKLTARLEVPRPGDVDKVKAAMPRILDIMQTYLREMRPEELRGSAGTYRLREELLARANTAVAPARISDVLFVQMLVQ